MIGNVLKLFLKREDLSNYRLISINPVVAKVMERIVYDQVFTHLTLNNLLSSHHSGFRQLHSTVTALLEATDNWAFNIDKGGVNAVVFLDLKKAFDTVNHDILLSKLCKYGIQGVSNDWLKSHLRDRNQKYFVNSHLSVSCCSPTAFLRKRCWGLYYFLVMLTTSQIVFPIVGLVCMQMTLI